MTSQLFQYIDGERDHAEDNRDLDEIMADPVTFRAVLREALPIIVGVLAAAGMLGGMAWFVLWLVAHGYSAL